MRDEGFETPFGVLNVPRNADLDLVESTFARWYKAARRQADGDARRQALNNALEQLRDLDRRAAAEVGGYHVPLDPTVAVPTPETLTSDILTVALPTVANPATALPQPEATELIERLVAALPGRPAADDRALLRQLSARVALELLDPWSPA